MKAPCSAPWISSSLNSRECPKLVWTFDQAGLGYSGPAIVGSRLYTCGGRGSDEFLFCLDVSGATPKELWSAKIGPLFQWTGNQWNKGPNVTPTFADGLIYALGGQGDLICVSASDGKEVWRARLPRDLGGEVNPIGGGAAEPTPLGWGYANAPLIDGDQLICAPGGPRGLLAALDRKTGKVLWRSSEVTEQTSYASPITVEIGGIRQYVQAINAGMVGIAAKDGKKLWSYVRQPSYDDVVIATPVFHDNHVFSTVGFAQGCDLVKLSAAGAAMTAEKVYSNKSIENRDGGVVLVDGHLYGHSENVGWFCQEFKTGKTVWSERRKLGRGSIAYADGRLYCVAEEGGTVALIDATPKGWTEHGRFQLPKTSSLRQPSGRLWTHPVIANGRLYVRDQELLFCFDVKQ
jgi:outer membrane protein assembly factor BamB